MGGLGAGLSDSFPLLADFGLAIPFLSCILHVTASGQYQNFQLQSSWSNHSAHFCVLKTVCQHGDISYRNDPFPPVMTRSSMCFESSSSDQKNELEACIPLYNFYQGPGSHAAVDSRLIRVEHLVAWSSRVIRVKRVKRSKVKGQCQGQRSMSRSRSKVERLIGAWGSGGQRSNESTRYREASKKL